MSRHCFPGDKPGVTVAIGWDAPLATFFLQVEREEDDELLIWHGGRYGECGEPGPLLVLARQWSSQMPDSLLAWLLTDELAAPAQPRRPGLID
jgi:hypothetical protein